MSKYSFGYVPDKHDKSNDVTIRSLFGAPNRLPAEFSLEPYITAIYDQGQLSDCVGWSFASTIELRLRVMKTPIELPSPMAIYTFARVEDRGTAASGPLQDQGCQPIHAANGLSTYGAPPVSKWPVDPSHVNDEPNLLEIEVSSEFKFTGFYRINSIGQQRLADVRQAIANGYPVSVGTAVDQAFENYDGTGVITAPDMSQVLGGHMISVVGYRADGTFRGRNQWSTQWGDSGMFTADSRWVMAPAMGDLYVITAAATGHKRAP